MQPAHRFTGWITADLTSGQIHIIDGKIIACFPKAWEKVGEKQALATVNGTVQMQQYKVTSWNEVELQAKT